MSGLCDISHQISTSSSSSKGLDVPTDTWKDILPKESNSSSRGKKSTPQQPPPPQPLSQKEINERREKDLEDRKKELIFKSEMYLKSPVFKHLGYFENCNFKIPKITDSYETVQSLYDSIEGIVMMGSKRLMTRSIFTMFLDVGETTGSRFLHLPTAGFSAFCMANLDKFEPELEQISIELSNKIMPDPKLRLLIKTYEMWKEFQMMENSELLKQKMNALTDNQKQFVPC